MTIAGLNNSRIYSLIFYGSRANLNGTQTSDLTVVNWRGIFPVEGVIAFTVQVSGGVGAVCPMAEAQQAVCLSRVENW